MSRALNALEVPWLLLDSADTPMHVGALLVFEAPAGTASTLAAALRGQPARGAPWTRGLRRGRGRLPRWRETEADLEWHLHEHALPRGGSERELGALLERLHSAALDPRRPPWEVHVIDRLHDGRFALYCKLHAASMDAPGFIGLLTGALAASPGQPPRAFWAQAAEASARGRGLQAARAALAGLSRETLESARALAGALGRLLRGAPGLQAPYSAPRSALNARIDGHRRCATQQYEMARLERAARACDATLEELSLFLCGSVLRRFFKEHNALPEEPLVAMLLAQRTQEGADDSSLSFVSLGTRHADARRRLDEVRTSVRAAREHLAALPDAAVPAYSVLTVAPYLLGQVSGLGGLLPAMFNLVIAGMRGPAQPRYLGDARLVALYPLLPLAQHGALSIGALSYAGTLNIGISGARDTLPRLQRMAVYMGEALADLEARIEAGAMQ